MINPWCWLGASAVALAVVRAFDARRHRHTHAALAALARESRMNYSAIDRFDLSHRLQQSPQWTAGLDVRDILYGATKNERRFVATLDRRATPDDPVQSWVVCCAERLDDGQLRDIGSPIAIERDKLRIEAYRIALTNETRDIAPSLHVRAD